MKKTFYILLFLMFTAVMFGQQNHQKVVLTNKAQSNNINYNIFPNPLLKGSKISLNFFSRYNIAMIITVTDLLGNIILEKNIDANAGNNKYFLNTVEFKQGIYFVHIFDGEERDVHRFMVK